MSTEKTFECDICGLKVNERDLHSQATIFVKKSSGLSLWWWRGGADYSSMDLCNKCTDLIYSLRRQNEKAKALTKIMEYRDAMCSADAQEFDVAIRDIASTIDRYRGDNRKIYDSIIRNSIER